MRHGHSRAPLVWAMSVFAAIWFTVGASAALAEPAQLKIKDVPTDHWAYQAVSELVSKGYLAVYGDGTFQGNKPVDRYTLASVIARLVDEVEEGRLPITAQDLEILRKLSTEFREEMVKWYQAKSALEERLVSQEKNSKIVQEKLNQLLEGPTDAELEDARRFLVGSIPRMLETNAGIAQFLQMVEQFGLGLDYDVRLPALIGAVTREAAHEAARLLSPDRAAVVVAGPYDGALDGRPPAA